MMRMKTSRDSFLLLFCLISWMSFPKAFADSASLPAQESQIDPQSKLDCRRLLEQDPKAIQEILGKTYQSQSVSQWALVRVMCRYLTESPTEKATATATLKTSLPNCEPLALDATSSKNSNSLCVGKTSGTAEFQVGHDFKNTGLYAVIRYTNRYKTIEFNDKDIQISVQATSSEGKTVQAAPPPINSAVQLGGGIKEMKCRIFVSGAADDTKSASCSGASCTPTNFVTLANGKLIFDAILEDVPSDLVLPKKISWTGGPDTRGIWEAAPTNQILTVRANVESKTGETSQCAIQLRQLGQGYTLSLNRYGECPYFRSLRDYYYLNSTNTGPQIGGYQKALSIPGFEATYGSSSPDMPFRGVFNSALDNQGKALVQDGRSQMPDINNRPYTAAIVVGRSLDPKLNQIGRPLFWGTLDPLDYKLTSIHGLGPTDLPDETLISFQFFLAKKQVINGRDIRGSAGGLPLYEFKEGISGVPFDRLVPVVNESCMPVFQVRAPARSDKSLPPELKDDMMCAFSRPFTIADLKAGRVNLTVLHMTAENAFHEFPIDLIKGDEGGYATEIAYRTEGNTNRTCWTVNPRILGDANWADGGYGGFVGTRATASVNSVTTTERQRIPGNECSTRIVTRTTQTTTYSGGGNELNGRLGYRNNWTAFFWGAALGCAVTQNWVGVPVYGTVEGTAASSGTVTAPPLGAQKPHFDKISCSIGSRTYEQASSQVVQNIFSSFSNEDSKSDPGSIALASYVFNQASFPSSQVRIQRFHVRPWGYATENLASDAAGSFDVPLCPGSQFSYDNISLSWSPLILDLKGKGISISREFKKSVAFDIRGKGYLSYVDWPENTSDVAFLVLPNSKGQITSIRELFGDGDGFENGFEKLKKNDVNRDGQIDKQDPIFKKLALWLDLNRNGKSDPGEIQSLSQHGVEKISIQYSRPSKGLAAPQRTLTGLYYNSHFQTLMNIEDHYFNEYEDSKRKKFESENIPAKPK